MSKRRLYDEDIQKKVTDATETVIEGREVDQGWVRYVTHACLEEIGTAPTTLAFGKKIGERFEPLEEIDNITAGRIYHTEKTHHFIGGSRPAWRIEGGTVDDVLSGQMEGYEEQVS